MDYDALLSFVVFAEHRNFTHAARELHISQPALHVKIRKLGEAVGCVLYRRRGRGLSLTAEGKRLAAFGREVAERSAAVLDELHGRDDSRPVVLAAGEGALLHLLGPAIRRFTRSRRPLRLLTRTGPEAIEAVRDGRAHLAVAAGPSPPADLASRPLRVVGQVVVVPKAHRLARRRAVRPADLDGEELVVAPEGRPHRAMLEGLLATAGCRWRVAVEAAGWEPMLSFVVLGIGIAVVNDFCPPPRSTVAIPLSGAPTVTYHLVAREPQGNEGARELRRRILESTRAPS